MSIRKNEVKTWDIFETTWGEHILILNERPYKMLKFTKTVQSNIVVLHSWRQSGLDRPEAVVIEKWHPVLFDSLNKKIGRLSEEDAAVVAVVYAKRIFCGNEHVFPELETL